jgi:hypothetical protein
VRLGTGIAAITLFAIAAVAWLVLSFFVAPLAGVRVTQIGVNFVYSGSDSGYFGGPQSVCRGCPLVVDSGGTFDVVFNITNAATTATHTIYRIDVAPPFAVSSWVLVGFNRNSTNGPSAHPPFVLPGGVGATVSVEVSPPAGRGSYSFTLVVYTQ